MTSNTTPTRADEAGRLVLDIAIRIGIFGLIVYWCYVLIGPFIIIAIWGAILAVALYPVFVWLRARLGGRSGLAATLLTILGLVVVIGPASALGAALVVNIQTIAENLAAGSITVPSPPPGVAEWPIVGQELSNLWKLASVQLDTALARLAPQIKALGAAFLELVANAGIGLLQLIVAVIIAGFLFNRADRVTAAIRHFALRVSPSRGESLMTLAGATVQNVARGVVGIAILQSILAGIGLLAAGIPASGLLTFFVLVLSIIQIGPGLVILPVIIYAWVSLDTITALVFTVYIVPVMLLDNILKPIVMARGLAVPMLVIFIGVIGGTMAHGIVGLFVGPVVLAFGYTIVRAWVQLEDSPSSDRAADGEA